MSDGLLFGSKTRSGHMAEHGSNAILTFTPSDDELSLRAKAIRKRRAERANPFYILTYWPFALGILVAYFGTELQELLNELGVWAVRFVLPLQTMVYQANIGSSFDLPQNLQQIALEVQFPLEGLIVMRLLKQRFSLLAVIVQMLTLHSIATLVLWLISIHGVK